jgi:outer membrane protein assembly factor BamB
MGLSKGAAMFLRTTRRLCAAFGLAALAVSVSPVAVAQNDPDPVEGKWLGSGGTPEETVEIGLEFVRNAKGKLGMRITQPGANYFALDFGAPVRREGNKVVVEAMGFDLTLEDGVLSGAIGDPRSTATLRRAEQLPVEPAVPDLPAGPGPKWETPLGAAIFAAPAVYDGFAYVGTVGGIFQAVRASDGALAWTFNAGRPIFGEALATADAVYFACDDGGLYKLDRAKGTRIWRYDLGDGVVPRVLPHPVVYDYDYWSPRPVLAGGVLYIGSGDGAFHAVDAASGERKWRVAAGEKVRNGALVDGQRVVFGGDDGHVYALDRATGKELWRRDLKAPIDTEPVALDGRIVVGNRGPGIYALAADTGEVVWRSPFWGSWVESSPVIENGTVYIGSSDLTRVSAIDAKNGRVLWRTNVFGWSWGDPLLTAERIYVGVGGVEPYFQRHLAGVAALDKRTGKLLWRWPYAKPQGAFIWGFGSTPVRAGDLMLLAGLDGSLYAFPLG